ncbi:MAG: class I SAM-dependent methyltransferase, partial [Chloroflexota bacterium]
VDERQLDSDSLTVEVASNDGYLLQYYKEQGVPVLGVDPAANIAEVAEQKGIPTVVDFFGTQVAEKLVSEGKRASVIHAHNVLAHVANLNDVVAGMATLLADDGVVVVEAPYVKDLIDHLEFDTIYHEHLCYFSLTALDKLFARHDLTITQVERVAIHGGSLRIFAEHADSAKRQDSVTNLLAEEAGWGVHTLKFYSDFQERVEGLKADLVAYLQSLKAEGHSIVAYGASAKGSTLLNYFGISAETLDFVADRSTAKQGYYTPGTHLEIVPPEALVEKQPDYTLLLVWNFAEEVLAQQQVYRDAGGKFIIPLPKVTIV